MKQEPLKRRRPAARKRGRKQTLRAVVLSVLTVSVIALCLGIWTRLPGEDVPVGGIEPPEDALSPASSVAAPEPEPEPQPVVETIRFSATGDDLIHSPIYNQACLLYTSDAADEEDSVDLGGRPILKKKKTIRRTKET